MTPEQKSRLIKLLIGALIAGGMAFLAYLTNGLKDIFSGVPFGLWTGLALSILVRGTI